MQLLHAIFRNNADFAALTDKAKTLAMTQKLWNEIVPEPFRSATQAGNIEHKRLTVYVDNGAVAAKIKLLLPSLLTRLKKQGVDITSIRVQVQVQANPEKIEKAPRALSASAAKDLSSLANKLEGTTLGDVLKRLSKRL
jgi:hypothetical protein